MGKDEAEKLSKKMINTVLRPGTSLAEECSSLREAVKPFTEAH